MVKFTHELTKIEQNCPLFSDIYALVSHQEKTIVEF